MSDLQIVLMIFGGLIIIAVLIFNWWQERRFHQQVENTFSNIRSDALLEEPKLSEPTLDSAALHEHDHDDDFSINHDLMQESEETHLHAEVTEPSFEQALYTPAESSEPQTATMPAMSEIMEVTDLPQVDDATVNVDVPESQPVNHNEIKAIFNDAFSKAATQESAQALNSDQALKQSNSGRTVDTATHLPASLNAQVDLIALLQLAADVSINEIADTLKKDFDSYDKPVFVHVQTADLRWLPLDEAATKAEFSGQKITKVACSLQLADRAGPASRSVINRFQMAVESLGLDINTHVEWQSTTDPAADASALDAFCIDVDKTMGFHLVHGENGAFTGTKLRGLAEAQGLELAADGSFKYYDEAAKKQNSSIPPSFVMYNRDRYPFSPEMLRQSVVKGITFQLDIPHVPNCTEAFNHMVLVARQMETGLHAQLVDDNNRPLGDAQVEKIRHQLKIIQATMQARGIAPGSDVALRLFS